MSAVSVDPSAHSFPYLEDGNLVLVALNAEGKERYFRVHRTILSHSSPVFADMFGFPAPAGNAPADDSYDGVQLVRLTDNAADLEGLLRLIYDPGNSFQFKKRDPDLPKAIEGPLRLADKYQMESIRARLVKCVTDDWPTTLADWDRLQSEKLRTQESLAYRRQFLTTQGRSVADIPDLDSHFPEPVSAILLARAANIPEILPAAYYALSMITSVRFDCTTSRPADSSDTFTARWGLLDNAGLLKLMRGQEKLIKYQSKLLSHVHEGLCALATCEDSMEDIMTSLKALDVHSEDSKYRDILEFLRREFSEAALANEHPATCMECRTMIAQVAQEDRDELWSRLPEFFDLPIPDDRET